MQFTCGACYYTGTITWWQHFLSDASSVLFYAGTLGLLASFFKNMYAILKRKPEMEQTQAPKDYLVNARLTYVIQQALSL